MLQGLNDLGQISAGHAGKLVGQHCQARLLVVRAEPAGTGEGGDAVQRAPGNLGQGLGVTPGGQWCDGSLSSAKAACSSRRASGRPKGSSLLRVNMAS